MTDEDLASMLAVKHQEIADLRHRIEALQAWVRELREQMRERTAERDSAVHDLYLLEQERDPAHRLIETLLSAIRANWAHRHDPVHRMLVRRDLRYLRELLA